MINNNFSFVSENARKFQIASAIGVVSFTAGALVTALCPLTAGVGAIALPIILGVGALGSFAAFTALSTRSFLNNSIATPSQTMEKTATIGKTEVDIVSFSKQDAGPIMKINIVKGDLLKQDVEVIVNAANSSIEGGGGIDGAIHRAAGHELVEACRKYKKDNNIQKVEVGEAMITESFEIQKNAPSIQFVIHTVGPDLRVRSLKENKEKLLANAYRNALLIAKEKGLKSIAFPAISTGIYQYPFAEAQRVVLETLREHLEIYKNDSLEIRLVYFSEQEYQEAKQIYQEFENIK